MTTVDFSQDSKELSLSLVFPCLSIIAKTPWSSKQNSVLISAPFAITIVCILFVMHRLLRTAFPNSIQTPVKALVIDVAFLVVPVTTKWACQLFLKTKTLEWDEIVLLRHKNKRWSLRIYEISLFI